MLCHQPNLFVLQHSLESGMLLLAGCIILCVLRIPNISGQLDPSVTVTALCSEYAMYGSPITFKLVMHVQ